MIEIDGYIYPSIQAAVSWAAQNADAHAVPRLSMARLGEVLEAKQAVVEAARELVRSQSHVGSLFDTYGQPAEREKLEALRAALESA